MDAIVLLRGHGPDALPVVAGDATLGDGAAYHTGVDFVIYGGGGTLRIAPLRPLSAKPTTILFAPGTELVPGSTPVLARQSLRWGGLPHLGLSGP